MTSDPRGEVTRLLGEVAAGNEGAREALIEQVYQQLHDMAQRLMRQERRDHSWGATDLVHEAYLQLFQGTAPTRNRAYFFGAAVRAMRRLLIARARSPTIERRRKRVPLDDLLDELETAHQVSMEDLDQALCDLEGFAPREHEVVLLRVFGRLRVQEVAAHLGVSVSTVEKDWKWARAWLYTRLRGGRHDA
jgi:RNA polymerase sigma factor (TIGR02999 family)